MSKKYYLTIEWHIYVKNLEKKVAIYKVEMQYSADTVYGQQNRLCCQL
jgi:hypothetical protein